MNEIKKDINLREAVRRREQQLPPMPDDLNARLLQRLEAQETTSKPRKLPTFLRWTAAAAMLVGIGFLGLRFGSKETASQPAKETPPVAEVVEPAPPVVQNEDKEPQETLPQAAEKTTASKRSRLRKQKPKLQQAEAKTTANAEEPLPKDSTPLLLATAADSLEYYVARLEREMEAISDSVRASDLSLLVKTDVRLQHIAINPSAHTAGKMTRVYHTTDSVADRPIF